MSFILLQHSLTAENANSAYQRLYNIETLQYCDRNFPLGYFKLITSFFLLTTFKTKRLTR